MSITHYQDLIVWQRAMDLVQEVYGLVRLLPRDELYALSSQMRRAAISIPSNIAEGQQRNSTKEFANFLSYAKGSVAELETQLILCVRLNYLRQEQINTSINECKAVGKMLNALIASLPTKDC